MKKRTGFTLIEVLVVVIIIAVLAAVAVPQYQKAVLKSRFSSLMPTTKAVRDGNEAYYMAHGGYASTVSQLDVTTANNNNMMFELSRDPDYSYVLATRSDLNGKNNLIIYQKHSTQFSGEIHCEALADDTQANWLCETGMHATQNLGEVMTEGYNTYVIEGTGNGLTPAQMDAAISGPSCDRALAMGATCSMTTENNVTTKQVCFGAAGGAVNICVSNKYDENGKLREHVTCSSNTCLHYKYDAEGNTTWRGSCGSDKMTSDGKGCAAYSGVYEYEYTAGNVSKEKYCSSFSGKVDGESCSAYDSITYYQYENGQLARKKECNNWANTVQGDSCSSYNRFSKYDYENGKLSRESFCDEVAYIAADGESCSRYKQYSDYKYDNGNLSRVESFQVGCGSGGSYAMNSAREYDYRDGKLFEISYLQVGTSGERVSTTQAYEYDDEGNAIYSYWCQEWNSDKTQCLRAQIGCSQML